MSLVCVDTCFLIGLYDERDQHHARAKDQFLRLFDNSHNKMAIPWPVVYEAVSTRMVRNRNRLRLLENDWKKLAVRQRLTLISDLPYRENVVQDCFSELGKPAGSYRELSTADRVIRNILADRGLPIDALLTFNFGDFADVCGRYHRELVY